jgi:hypothetical protein
VRLKHWIHISGWGHRGRREWKSRLGRDVEGPSNVNEFIFSFLYVKRNHQRIADKYLVFRKVIVGLNHGSITY